MKIQDALDLHLKEEASRIIGERITVHLCFHDIVEHHVEICQQAAWCLAMS
jgi:hypothetical protein